MRSCATSREVFCVGARWRGLAAYAADDRAPSREAGAAVCFSRVCAPQLAPPRWQARLLLKSDPALWTGKGPLPPQQLALVGALPVPRMLRSCRTQAWLRRLGLALSAARKQATGLANSMTCLCELMFATISVVYCWAVRGGATAVVGNAYPYIREARN